MVKVSTEQAYKQMRTMLNEKQWRQDLAIEAKQRGSVSQVAQEADVSINWRATPLTPLEVVLELISHTTIKEGLAVTAIKDRHTYPTGIKVSDDELAAINLSRHSFHGEWNYRISPKAK